ncbi:coiled-coil domain-containing protein 158 [Pelodytes ibericus]
MASKTLQALRDELEGQTREIQKLQSEVEQATQHTINKLPASYRETPLGQTVAEHFHSTKECVSSAVVGNALFSPSLSLHNQIFQHSSSTVHHLVQDGLSSSHCELQRQHLRQSIDEQQRQHLRQSIDEQQSQHLRQSIDELHSKIQRLEIERDVVLGIRLQETKTHEDANKQLHITIQELQEANQLQDTMLKQSHIYTELLRQVVQRHSTALQDIKGVILTYEGRSGKKMLEPDNVSYHHIGNLPTSVENVLQQLQTEVSFLKSKLQPAEDQLDRLKKELQAKEALLASYQKRYDNVISEHEQQVAVLTLEANTARSHAKDIQGQMENLQEQVKDLGAQYVERMAHLASTVSQLQVRLKNMDKLCTDKAQSSNSNSATGVKFLTHKRAVPSVEISQVPFQCSLIASSTCSTAGRVRKQNFWLDAPDTSYVGELQMQLVASDSALTEAHSEHVKHSQKGHEQRQQLSEALQLCEKQLRTVEEHNRQLLEQGNVLNLTNEQLRRELVERSMEAERLHDTVKFLKEDHQQQMEQQTTNLRLTASQLVTTKELLEKTSQELAAKTQSLGSAERSIADLKKFLEEKEKSLRNTVHKLNKLRSHTEKHQIEQSKLNADKMQEVLKDMDRMRLLLAEKDQFIVAVQGQLDNMCQVAGQQTEKANVVQAENFQLLQKIKTIAEKKDARLHELETNKVANAASDLRNERDQVMEQLKVARNELESLAADYELLKRNYQNRNGERDSTSSLKKKLHAALTALDQTRNTLAIMEYSDGRAIQVASRMQRTVTAKRKIIDTLQSRIQLLEEALSYANKDKQHLQEENEQLMHSYDQKTAERSRLSGELETLHNENNTLKERVTRTQAALDKASLQFSECQTIIQCLEQELLCIKLQHTLDMKELKGVAPGIITSVKPPNVTVPASCQHSNHFPSTESCLSAVPTKVTKQSSKNHMMEKPTRDIVHLSDKFQVLNSKETCMQQNKISEDLSDYQHTLMEPLTLHSVDLQVNDPTFSFIHTETPFLVTPCYTSSPNKCFNDERSGTRSPVHSLLAASVDAYEVISTPVKRPPSKSKDKSPEDSIFGESTTETASDTCQKLQRRLENLQTMAKSFQMKNKGFRVLDFIHFETEEHIYCTRLLELNVLNSKEIIKTQEEKTRCSNRIMDFHQ